MIKARILESSKTVSSVADFERWWRFQYAHRYFLSLLESNSVLAEEFESTLKQLAMVFRQVDADFAQKSFESLVMSRRFNHFLNSLVYLYHKEDQEGDFYRFSIELAVSVNKYSLEVLSEANLYLIERLHDWTYQLGFLASLFYSPPTAYDNWELAFAQHNHCGIDVTEIEEFSYQAKRGRQKGIEVWQTLDRVPSDFKWDMLIHYNLGDRFYRLSEQIRKHWRRSGKQKIGVSFPDSVRFYVNRADCSITELLGRINECCSYDRKLRRGHQCSFLQRQNSRSVGVSKKSLKACQKILDNLAAPDNKTWGVEKNNFRRAIALYHWDVIKQGAVKSSRKSLIGDTISILRSEAPDALINYVSKFHKYESASSKGVHEESKLVEWRHKTSSKAVFKKPMYGDTATSNDSVERLMEADFDLTDYCIDKLGYYLPYQLHKESKSKN